MKHLDPMVPLGRLPYAVIGVLLALVKIALDAFVAHHYGRAYSLLFYVDPTTAPLLRPGEMVGYWTALWCETVPFAAIGVMRNVKARAETRDAVAER